MVQQVLLGDKPAVKINAKLESNKFMSGKAGLYNCEGDEVWIPHKVCKYDEESQTLLIEEWFYKKLVSEGKL